MTDQEIELLAKTWKGLKCFVCQFDIDQIEIKEIVETENGYAHKHCLENQALDEVEESELIK